MPDISFQRQQPLSDSSLCFLTNPGKSGTNVMPNCSPSVLNLALIPITMPISALRRQSKSPTEPPIYTVRVMIAISAKRADESKAEHVMSKSQNTLRLDLAGTGTCTCETGPRSAMAVEGKMSSCDEEEDAVVEIGIVVVAVELLMTARAAFLTIDAVVRCFNTATCGDLRILDERSKIRKGMGLDLEEYSDTNLRNIDDLSSNSYLLLNATEAVASSSTKISRLFQ
nr:hypothetical protein Iba_chr08dCG9230 [Ipomoea batatas]